MNPLADTLSWPFFEERHRAFAARVEAWAGAEAGALTDHLDVDASCRRLVAAMGEAGLLVPTVAGSGPLDVRTLCLARDILARHSGLADFSFAMQGLGAGPISLQGTPEQKARHLPRVASGEAIAAFALTEPRSGSDVASTETTARIEGDTAILDGEKTWISNGGIADFYVVFARTGEGPGRRRAVGPSIVEGPTRHRGLGNRPSASNVNGASSPELVRGPSTYARLKPRYLAAGTGRRAPARGSGPLRHGDGSRRSCPPQRSAERRGEALRLYERRAKPARREPIERAHGRHLFGAQLRGEHLPAEYGTTGLSIEPEDAGGEGRSASTPPAHPRRLRAGLDPKDAGRRARHTRGVPMAKLHATETAQQVRGIRPAPHVQLHGHGDGSSDDPARMGSRWRTTPTARDPRAQDLRGPRPGGAEDRLIAPSQGSSTDHQRPSDQRRNRPPRMIPRPAVDILTHATNLPAPAEGTTRSYSSTLEKPRGHNAPIRVSTYATGDSWTRATLPEGGDRPRRSRVPRGSAAWSLRSGRPAERR